MVQTGGAAGHAGGKCTGNQRSDERQDGGFGEHCP